MLAPRLLRPLHALGSALRCQLARLCGAKLGAGVLLDEAADLRPGLDAARRGSIDVGSRCRIARGVILRPYGGSILVGRDTFLGEHVVIYGHGGVEIGPECLIAMHCRILSSEHTIPEFGKAIRTQPDIPKPTRLGRDVWLGAGVTVLGGVTIGEGCVVGAGAVVTKDLPPGTIAAGVPAKVIGLRPGR